MSRKRSLILVSALLLAVLAVSWLSAAAQAPKPKIIGVDKCKVCHKMAKSGDQHTIWLNSLHAKAYATLAGEQAKAIGAKMGIDNPQTAAQCLECHTTKGFLKTAEAEASYKIDEGVGCEACHGAGSEYKTMSIMKDRAAAIKAGMVVGDEKTCVACHNEKSPTYKPFKYAEFWKAIAHPVPAPAK